MQLRLKGFVTIESLISNVESIIAPVGEISTRSLTYAKDKGIYNSATKTAYSYYSFLSAFEGGITTVVPDALQGQIFAFSDWIYQKQKVNGSPSSRFEFLTDMVNQFTSEATSLNCGEMIEISSGFFFPEWVSWSKSDLPQDDPAKDNLITVWFSDASFGQQYDEFAIEVIPPLESLATFFSGKSAVVAALAARTLGQTLMKVQEAKGGHPETIVSGENFDYVDPISGSRTPTNWTLLIYGQKGDDIDAIRESIRDHIAANSTQPEADWRAIFPDIYKNTEFLIYPRWKNYAIADRVLLAGTYSPVVSLKRELDYLKVVQPGLLAAHIDAHATVIPSNYKSLALLLIGGPDNRDSIYDITRIYPDIINVPTSDTLFESMSFDTREWILGIERMIIIAETVSAYTDMPLGIRKVIRAGVIYVTAKFGNTNYLIASKMTTPDYTS